MIKENLKDTGFRWLVNHRTPVRLSSTKCKCHKGFRGLRGSEVRFNFSCNLIGNHPQSLTALTLSRCKQAKKIGTNMIT